MAQRVEFFAVTTPANTPASAPITTSLAFTDGLVKRIEIVVPDGHAGLTGLQLAYGGQVIIPDSGTLAIVSNDEKIGWDLADYPTGQQWQAVTYNTDLYQHTHYLRFLIDEFPRPVGAGAGQPVLIGV